MIAGTLFGLNLENLSQEWFSKLVAMGCSAAFMTWSKPSQDHQGLCKCQPNNNDKISNVTLLTGTVLEEQQRHYLTEGKGCIGELVIRLCRPQKVEQTIMSSEQTVKIFKKSAIPGVVITQFVNDVPQGCSTPDFEKKPLTLTLQEGKTAIFRAVVKGVPAPEVKWSRTRKGMDDPAKYEMSFDSATNEFILQIKSLVLDDSDLYRCSAVNAYGEASCCAGLRIIQVGFKRKAKYVPVHAADELKRTLLDSKKLLRKRVAAPKPKPLDKEAVWQLLLHADRRDYEKICMKYGIVDFRGMLRKLQEMRKDTETEQDKLIHNLRNFEHIKVNKEGNATFSLEMELKNSSSNVYLLKDGERLRYGTGDEYRKHCLRRVGRRYYFTVNDVQPEDAGVYQVKVEDVPIFSTELDAQAIPVRFRQPLSDVRCAEAGDAEFQCVLCTPCHEPLWLHKSHPLQANDKHQMTVTPDGLTHKLIVRNVGPSDSGLYTLDVGQGSSRAWLLVEYAKGKRTQDEGEKIERETSEWLKETMADNERARKLRRQEQAAAEDHPSFSKSSGVEKSGWYRTGQGSTQGRGRGHSIDSDDGSQRVLGKEGLRKTHLNGEVGSGQFSGAGLDGESAANDGSIFGLKGLEGRTRLRPVHSMDSVSGRAGPAAVGGAGEWNSMDGRGEGVLGAADIDMDDGDGLGSQHDKDGNLVDASYRAGFGGAGRLGAGSSVPDGFDPDSTGVGASVGDLFGQTGPGTGAGGNAASAGIAGRMRSHHSKDGYPTVGDMNGAEAFQVEMGLYLVLVAISQEKWRLCMVQMVRHLEQVLVVLVELVQGDLDLPMERMVSQSGLVLVVLVQGDLDLHMERMVFQLELALVVQEDLELPMGRMVYPLEQVLVRLVVQGDLDLPMERMFSHLGLVVLVQEDLDRLCMVQMMVSHLEQVLGVVLVQGNLEFPMERMVSQLELVVLVQGDLGIHVEKMVSLLDQELVELQVVVLEVLDRLMEWMVSQLEQVLVGLVVQGDLDLPMGRMVSQVELVLVVQKDLGRLYMMVGHLEQVLVLVLVLV
ncbi:hypothetical protein TURU_044051 [Turdus rufiventris]|nr:hypothetical protein TURU_044051 [Turdus rufiventris]